MLAAPSHMPPWSHGPLPSFACSTLLALHRTTTLRHDTIGQETLLNLLLRNYLHYGLYDQVRGCIQFAHQHSQFIHTKCVWRALRVRALLGPPASCAPALPVAL